jgi:HK97 family phage portal protein
VTVVVSDGQAVPLFDRKSWPLAGMEQTGRVTSARQLDLLGIDLKADYAAIYASQPWIYALVNKVTRNIARLPLRALREDPLTMHKEPLPRTHELPALISRPFPRGSKFRLVESVVGSLMIFGHALCWKYRPRPGMPPMELWPLDWSRVSIQAGKDVPIDFYEYRAARGAKALLPDDVVHFTWWSPMGLRGTSPLEPLRTTLLLEDAGRRYAVASFANGVRPSGALVTEKKLGPEAKAELRQQIESMYATPDSAFRMMLLDGGLDWKAFSHTSQEAQTIEHRKLNAIEACAVYDMPPPMVQILDHATFSNIDEQHRMLYQDTLGPVAVNLEETLGAQLLWGEPALGAAADPEDGEIENTLLSFDFDDVLRADIVKRAAAYAAMRAAGGITVNDLRRAEGKPEIDRPEANAVLIPLNMAAIGPDGVFQFPTERVSDPNVTLAPGQASLETLAAALMKEVDGKIEGLHADLKGMEGALRSQGQSDLASSVAALAKEIADQDRGRVELKADRLEHVVHEHKTEHVHEEVVPSALLDEFRGGLRSDLDRAVEQLASTLGAKAHRQFEYGDDGLVRAVVETAGDTMTRYVAERDGQGRLTKLTLEEK